MNLNEKLDEIVSKIDSFQKQLNDFVKEIESEYEGVDIYTIDRCKDDNINIIGKFMIGTSINVGKINENLDKQ